MKQTLCLLLSIVVFFAGCAGREAYPVQSYIPGDEKKSCVVLKAEMAQIEADILKKLPHADKTGGNILLGVAGAFLIVPWFFMDLKGADKIEVEALQRRYNTLSILAADKECVISGKTANALNPDSPETKAMQEEIAILRQELKEKTSVKSDENAVKTETN